MQCRMLKWLPVFGVLSLPTTCVPADSFCTVYNKVVQQKGDGNIQASSGVKRRILANELTYKEQCLAKV